MVRDRNANYDRIELERLKQKNRLSRDTSIARDHDKNFNKQIKEHTRMHTMRMKELKLELKLEELKQKNNNRQVKESH